MQLVAACTGVSRADLKMTLTFQLEAPCLKSGLL
jgi:hypothetical protein